MALLSFIPRELFARGLPTKLEVFECDLGASAALAVLRDLGSAEAFVDSFANATTAVWPAKGAGFYFEANVGSHGGRQFLANRATLYYKRVHDHDVGLAREIEALMKAVGLPAARGNVEAVVSRPGAGVSMHFDADAAINVQIFGTKAWTWEPNAHVDAPVHAVNAAVGPSPAALRHASDPAYPKQMSAAAQKFSARPGTVTYLPRGVWHQTEVTGDETSLAIVFSLELRTLARAFAEQLVAFLHEDAAWRQSVLLGPDPARAWDATAAAYGALDADDIELLLPAFACSRWSFAPAAKLGLEGSSLHVTRDDETKTLELDDTLAAVRPAIEWIVAHAGAFRAAELCVAVRGRVEPIAVVELLRLLVDGELLERRARTV
jgi:Cupin superfamily protein